MKNASPWTKPLPFSNWDSTCCRQMHIHLCHSLLSDSIILSTYGYGNNIKQLVIISGFFLEGCSYWSVKISRKSKPPERKTLYNWGWHVPNRRTLTHPGKSKVLIRLNLLDSIPGSSSVTLQSTFSSLRWLGVDVDQGDVPKGQIYQPFRTWALISVF